MLLQRLQLLARLEADRLAGRDGNLGAGTRVAADAGLTGLYVEDAEAAQFNAVALFQRFLHGFKDRFHCHFGLSFGDAGPVHDLVDDVQLDQNSLLAPARGVSGSPISQPHDRIEFILMSSEGALGRMTPVTSEEFRRACGCFATGVTIASVVDLKGVPHGLTVNAFTAVSLEPPLVLICLGHAVSAIEHFRAARYFGINMLAESQRD